MAQSLIRTVNYLSGKPNFNLMKLSECLKLMELPQRPYQLKRGLYLSTSNINKGFNIKKLDIYELQDLFNEAKNWWLKGCKEIQTQFVENHELAANWNSLWCRTKTLFSQRGVEIS